MRDVEMPDPEPKELIARGLEQLIETHGKEEVAKECASWLMAYCKTVNEKYMLITFEDCGKVEVVLND